MQDSGQSLSAVGERHRQVVVEEFEHIQERADECTSKLV